MSKIKKKSVVKQSAPLIPQEEVEQASKQPLSKDSVVMVFNDFKYYSDPNTPLYEPGKQYTIDGADMIQRWLKRGGKIVSGEIKIEEPVVNLSSIIEPEIKEPEAEIAPEIEQGQSDLFSEMQDFED
jgi:hypothetical protein